MGHWGVKSYENDGAADAVDAGLERVHGSAYEEAMDDRSPLSFDEAQRSLADPETLKAAVEALADGEAPGPDWDEDVRLAFAGVVVRHAEFGVEVPEDWRALAAEWLENESIDWHEDATVRRLRRENEIQLLRRPGESR